MLTYHVNALVPLHNAIVEQSDAHLARAVWSYSRYIVMFVIVGVVV
jgi:hypothetical protein